MTDEFTFNLSLEPDDEFDPLEDLGDEDEEESGGEEYIATASAVDGAPEEEETPPEPEIPAEERIANLFQAMAPRRKTLLGILSFCLEPQPVALVNERVDELQENNFSVYTAANLCNLLEKAGAIERVTPDGQPYEDVEVEPEVVIVDGVEYLEAREPQPVCWVTTEPGREALEADKPLERLTALLADDAKYDVIYKRILTLCNQEGGALTTEINNAVDNDPLVKKPRLYAPHFVDKLEKCDALEWKKTWLTTDIGRAGLEMLAGVVDEGLPKEKEN